MVVILLVIMTLYCIGCMGIIWLICDLLGCSFNLPVALGVWLLINYAIGFIRRGKKKHDRQ